jgi:16S rRNA (guanine966-N2)-methyltransferase
VRIIGGQWRKSVLRFPARPDLRPNPHRVRETRFNWQGQDMGGMARLDHYAGTGALASAASRGAARVVLVEADRGAVQALRENAERLNAGMLEIVAGDALAWLGRAERANERFDVVFLDPPFRQNAHPDLLARLPRVLKPGARVHVERRRRWRPRTPGATQARALDRSAISC